MSLVDVVEQCQTAVARVIGHAVPKSMITTAKIANDEGGNQLLTGIGIGMAVAGTYMYMSKAAAPAAAPAAASPTPFSPVVVAGKKDTETEAKTEASASKSLATIRERRNRFAVQINRGDDTGFQCSHFLRSGSEVEEMLEQYELYLKDRTYHHLGYPYNLEFNGAALEPFLQFSINNLGDPFVESNYGVHSRKFELEVLDFFAAIWKIPRKDFWGYTTTCGTEGNLLSIIYGREKLPDAVLYCSNDSHYSVPKAGNLFRIPVVLVESQMSGEMDYDDFRKKLKENAGKPAIVSINIGTTVKGAVDSLAEVKAALSENDFTEENTFIHCDGALAGLLLPFAGETEVANSASRLFQVSFEKGVDTISVSGHKMLGCPMPCGVVITKKEHMKRFAKTVEYLNSTDTTIMGSRNGQASIAMWVALQQKHGIEGLKADVSVCFKNARFLLSILREAGVSSLLNKYSTTVVFERPPPACVKRWQLACTGNIAHVVVMPSTDQPKLKAFVEDYLQCMTEHALAGGGRPNIAGEIGAENCPPFASKQDRSVSPALVN